MITNASIPILIVAIVVIIALVVVWYASRRSHTEKLRKKYGPEYDYAVQKEGDPHKAEQALEEREKRVNHLQIHPLEVSARDRYNTEWKQIQSKFVDDPKGAVNDANRLITEVMVARGFPVADFDHRAEDLSVLYPNFVQNYRNANAIAVKNQDVGASTEELRKAMVYYHSLFDQLLETEHNPESEMEATR